jgi:hypothetical protein
LAPLGNNREGSRYRHLAPRTLSHDTDKLIRQLSLVAFLMAERRPITARDVKQNVEGYSEMSDEAFARRFYSDRAELVGLGVPLESQRDEFTGEELYTLSSRRSSRRSRSRFTSSRGSSPMPSRSASRSRTWRSAVPPRSRLPPKRRSESSFATPITRPRRRGA